jgi:hypothetical protein
MTISVAGFGHTIRWEDEEVSPGHRLSFKQAVEVVSAGVFLRVLCPKWIYEWAPTKRIREVRDGFTEFRVCSLRMCCFSSAENRSGVCSRIWWR